jgi:hypothetical protein
MKKKEKADFNFRISQSLGLTYNLFSDKDSNALQLLEYIKNSNDFSLEWNSSTKEYNLIIFINLFGQKFTDLTIRGVICRAFEELYLSE